MRALSLNFLVGIFLINNILSFVVYIGMSETKNANIGFYPELAASLQLLFRLKAVLQTN